MGADGGDPLVFQKRDPVSEHDGRSTVRNHQRSCPTQHGPKCLLDLGLGVDIQRRLRIVKDQHTRVTDHRTGQGQPLPLPAGQRHPLFSDPGVQTPR